MDVAQPRSTVGQRALQWLDCAFVSDAGGQRNGSSQMLGNRREVLPLASSGGKNAASLAIYPDRGGELVAGSAGVHLELVFTRAFRAQLPQQAEQVQVADRIASKQRRQRALLGWPELPDPSPAVPPIVAEPPRRHPSPTAPIW